MPLPPRVHPAVWLLLLLLLTASGCAVRPSAPAPAVPVPVVPDGSIARVQIGPSPGGFGIVTEATIPATCTAGRQMVLVVDADDGSCPLRRCDPTGGAFACVVQAAPGIQTTGVRLSATEILAVNHAVLPLTDSTTLGTHNRILALPGVTGITLTLPDAASATVSDYWIAVADTSGGSVTLAPSGTDTINGSNTARTITGLGQFFQVKRLVATGWTDWFVEQTTEDVVLPQVATAPTALGSLAWQTTPPRPTVGLGSQAGSLPAQLCNVQGTSTNISSVGSGAFINHSLTCTVQANTLWAGHRVTTCGQFEISTGATAPTYRTRLAVGSTALAFLGIATVPTSSLGARTRTVCWETQILEDPSASSDTRTGPLTQHAGNLVDNPNNTSTAQPVAIATNAATVWTIGDEWGSAGGAGEDTAILYAMWVVRW